MKKPLSNNATLEVILALFFWWGFLTSINDILVPHFRALFTLSYAEAVLVPVTFFTTCFVLAPVSSVVIDRQGYRRTMVLGLLIMGIGAFMFLPAAQSQSSYIARLRGDGRCKYWGRSSASCARAAGGPHRSASCVGACGTLHVWILFLCTQRLPWPFLAASGSFWFRCALARLWLLTSSSKDGTFTEATGPHNRQIH